MSVELAAISGLKKSINEKFALTRDFTFTAGMDINKGEYIAIGTDGQAYSKYIPDNSKVLGEAGYSLSQPVTYSIMCGSYTVDNTHVLTLINNVYWNANYSNEWRLHAVLSYEDADGSIKQAVAQITAIDSYTSTSSPYYYRGLYAHLHQIDATTYMAFWNVAQRYYDGSAYSYANYIYYVPITIDVANNTISVGSTTTLYSDTNNAIVGSYYPWYYTWLPFSQSQLYFHQQNTNTLHKITIDTTHISASLTSNTAISVNDYIYNAVVPLVNGGFLAVCQYYANHYKFTITDATATDFTSTQIASSSAEDIRPGSISISFDVGKILVQDLQKTDKLYVMEYDATGALSAKKDVTLNGFGVADILVSQNYYKSMPYKDADGNIWISFRSSQACNECWYQSPGGASGNYNYKSIIVKFYQGINGAWFADKMFEIMNSTGSAQPQMAEINGKYILISGAYRAFNNVSILTIPFIINNGAAVSTYPTSLVAKDNVLSGTQVLATTPDYPIAITCTAGEKVGDYVGVDTNLALPIKE